MKRSKLNMIFMWMTIIYLLIPLFCTFVYSICTQWIELIPTGFTTKFYEEIFADKIFWMAIGRTIIISFIPVLITTIVLLLAMYVVVVYLPSWDKYMQILCTIPYAVQGVILPISVLSLYNGVAPPFSNRILMLALTYCIVILPYMYQGIKNSIESVDAKRILDAVQMLGGSKFYGFFMVIVPCILKGIIISAMLSVAIIFGDFVIVNIIGGSYYYTAQMYLLKKMFISGQTTSAVIMVLFAVTLIISMTVFVVKSKSEKKENV